MDDGRACACARGGGALRFIEETFSLPSLGTTDQYEPDGLDSMFNFSQAPIPYTPVGGSAAQPHHYHPRAQSLPAPPDEENDS